MTKQLIFVYNADSGMFNTLTDIAHKIFSPQTYACNLCAISHSYFSERDEWKEFISGLDVDCEFLHRDEFLHKYNSNVKEFPVVFELKGDDLILKLSADKINSCKTMDDLKVAITTIV
ncbi:MAG: hypothetical protein OEW97_05250 [Gammaproteobacteria bacterium]|nr:hypothetical protein [Gammaproteobacteria bacterium]